MDLVDCADGDLTKLLALDGLYTEKLLKKIFKMIFNIQKTTELDSGFL